MTITHIIHLSDIHIRTGNLEQSRYNEYISVFDNLFFSLKQHTFINTSLICITGDIFHNKSKIENYGLHIFQYLISNLTKIAPIIIIPGNHDFRQDFPNEPSLLSSILTPSDKIYYLDKTQIFNFQNIQFSTVSVYDTLNKGNTSGISSILPKFPIDNNSTLFKIALFHGTFGKTKLNSNNNADENHSYPLQWIQDFDFALLGDIHLRQKGTYNNLIYAYSGSLIQQNFGEEPILHGYYIWDLYNKKIKPINIYNDIGFLNLSFHQDNWNIKYKGQYVSLSTFIQNKDFPKKPIIRINTTYTNHQFSILDTLFKQYNIQYQLNLNIQPNITHYQSHTNNHYYDKNKWIDYFQNDTIKKWISNPETLIIPNNILTDNIKKIIPKIIDKNNSIDKELQIYLKSLDTDNKSQKTFFIKYLSWDYLLCFGKNCYFNFEKGYQNIISIDGKNATGKSSFFEIICYALYGEAIPSRHKKDESYAIVNYNKPHNNVPKTSITFLFDNIEYTLVRHYYNNGKNSITYRNTALYQKNIKEPIKSDKKAIEIWLKDNICSLQFFLSLNMITQNLDFDIFSFKSDKQIEFLDEIFKISSIKNLKNLINESRKIYKHILELSNTVTQHNLNNSPNIDTQLYQDIKDKKISIQNNLKHKTEIYNTLYIDYNLYPLSSFDSDLSTQLSNLPSYNDITLQQAIFNKTKLIEQYKDIDYQSLSTLYNKDIQLQFDSLITIHKPPFDYQFILNEELILKKWFDFKPHSLQQNTSYYSNLINDINSKILDLYNNKPNKHDIDIDISNINIHILSDFCNQHPNIPKPTKPYPNKIPTQTLHQLQTQHDNILTQIQLSNTTITNNKNSLSLITDQINNKLQDIQLIQIYDKPEQSKQHIYTWLSNYSQLQTYFNKNSKKYNQLLHFFTQYDQFINDKNSIIIKNTELKTLIDQYNSSQYEFNPQCHICCKQPWLIHKQTLLNEYNLNINTINDIDKKIKLLVGKKNINYNRNKFNQLSENILNYNTYSQQIDYYQQLKTQIDQYLLYQSQLSQHNSSLNQLQEQKNNINNILTDSISHLLQLQTQLHDIQTDIDTHQLLLDWKIYNSHQQLLKYNYNKFKLQLQEYKSDLNSTQSLYDKSIINDTFFNQFQNRIQTYFNNKSLLDSYNSYIIQYNKLNNIIVSNKIIQFDTIIKNLEKRTFIQNIIDLLPIHKQKTLLKTEIDQLQIQLDEINVSFIKLNTIKESYEKTLIINNQLKEFNNYILDSYNSLITFHSKFDMFKDSIYNDHILPKFIENINNNIINASSQFSIPTLLHAQVTDNIIYWSIRKKINNQIITIPIQKASGFQKFIISLSFRITLINNSFKQFFIDEGFVHCDHNNLQMVPEFLYTLTNKFSYSIILVSHLATIKDNIHDTISISVSNDYSLIQF